jgi:hypothetical protein
VCAPPGHRCGRHWARDRTRTHRGRGAFALGLGPPFERRPGLLPPAGDGPSVALPSPPCGFLRAPAQRFEQAADMDRMVGDTKLQANHRGDPATGPDLPSKAISFCPTVQECGQAGQLFGGQPAGSTRAGAVPEGFRSLLAGTRHPLADRPFADAEGCGDLPLGPALLQKVPGVKSSDFLPIFGCGVHPWECSTAPSEL